MSDTGNAGGHACECKGGVSVRILCNQHISSYIAGGRNPATSAVHSVSSNWATIICSKSFSTFVMDRFAEPKIRITPEEGWKVSRILLNGEDVTEQFQDGYLTLEEVCEDTTLVIETAEDTSGGESKDLDKDKDPGKNPDKDKDPNKGTPGTGKGHESEKKTLLNKLKNQIAAVTGDEARPMLYALAAIAAAAVISVTVIRRKNK